MKNNYQWEEIMELKAKIEKLEKYNEDLRKGLAMYFPQLDDLFDMLKKEYGE